MKKPRMLVVIGKDKPGIIANVTGFLYRHQCNLEDVSMTILEGEFSMMMVVSQDPKRSRLEQNIVHFARKKELTIFWSNLYGSLKRGQSHHQDTWAYVITAMGKDQTGIVYKISQFLAKSGVNITDLQSKILGRGRSALYTLILEADIPKKASLRSIGQGLQRLSRALKIEIHMKPIEVLSM